MTGGGGKEEEVGKNQQKKIETFEHPTLRLIYFASLYRTAALAHTFSKPITTTCTA
jgi:hypothetical protein